MSDKSENLAQFKLSNGNEVVCDIIHERDEEEFIIAKNAMQIIQSFDADAEEIFFIFRPWLNFVETSDEKITIAKNHIVGRSLVNMALECEYYNARNVMNKSAEKRQMASVKKVFDGIFNNTDDQPEFDDSTNVLSFPDKDKLH